MAVEHPALMAARFAGTPDESGGVEVALVTARGPITCRLHAPEEAEAGVIWGFGSGGGLRGPAGGVFERLARRLLPFGVASLQVAWRDPGNLEPSVHDALAGVAFLESRGIKRIALVGHSFGGAVVVRAGPERHTIVAVAALSPQLRGTERVAALEHRPLLVIHGLDDEILPPGCGRDLYARARGPKEIVLYPRCRHGLDECRYALDRDLQAWLERVLEVRAAALGGTH